METSLHKALKAHYAGKKDAVEVRMGRYRIDALWRGQLVEVQCAGLAAIRDKIKDLCQSHKVKVVKPIIARKLVVRRDRKGGKVVGERYSPKRGDVLNLFEELVHFTSVFPHENLTLEIPLIEISEVRYPGHGRRRWRRKGDFVIEDQHLTEIVSTHRFRKSRDLLKLLPAGLPQEFHSGHIANGLNCPRWIAQKMAYTLRKTGALEITGKEGNAMMYCKAPVQKKASPNKSAKKKTAAKKPARAAA